MITKKNKINKLLWEMKILENLMKKDRVTEFDDDFYSRRYRHYKDELFKLGVTVIETHS